MKSKSINLWLIAFSIILSVFIINAVHGQFFQDNVHGDLQQVAVLIADSPSSPTVSEVVSSYESGSPSLQTIITTSPTMVRPLLSKRAEGDFLDLLIQNPDFPR